MGEARQSHAMESVSRRLPRHFVPRNDELIRVSLVLAATDGAYDLDPVTG